MTVLPDDCTLKLGSVSPDSSSGTPVVVSSPVQGAEDELSISPSKEAVCVTSILTADDG